MTAYKMIYTYQTTTKRAKPPAGGDVPKTIYIMNRIYLLETKVEPPAQKNVPKTICKSQVTIKHAKRHGVLSTAHPTNAPLVQHELQL